MKNQNVIFWSFTVALGGFLFGFDTAVISGAEGAIQKVWGLSNTMVGQMVAMALYGTVIGALLGGWPAERFGRKTSLFWIGVLYLISAAGSALAPDVYSLMFFRFIGGLGVGASSVVAPMYITEVAPKEQRGRLVAFFQFNIVLGIMVAYVSNWLIGSGSWRLMLGVETLPALAFVLLILKVPRSPRWLVVKRDAHDEALEVLQRINPETANQELAAIEHAHENARAGGLRAFLSGIYNRPILLAFLFAFFNQVSGINAVIYYAPRIFKLAGLEESAALLASTGIGTINLVFTLIGMSLIDGFGRRKLMYIGSLGYIVSLSAVAYAFYSGVSGGYTVPFWLFVFIASHAIGQGAVIWVFISEIFPNEVRSFGNSLGSGTHWVFAALIAGTFPYLTGVMEEYAIFALFAGLMVLQLLFVAFMMPETKGVSLEELQERLMKK
ncbi:MAG: sugar porter family MFS transporter [bacterium]|nr:sugar porter family MFS transporter [bacterium]